MLNTLVLAKVYELKDLLLESNEYKNVKKKEQLMEENCQNILIRYNYLFEEYNQALRFEKYGSDVNKIQKELNECKKELDRDEYIKDYRKAYKEIDKLLKSIQNTIFDKLIIDKSIRIE